MMPPVDCKREREIVQTIAEESGLLVAVASVRQRLRNAFEYTHEVARRMSADGWGLRLQTIGLAIDQCSIDSIVHRVTGDVACVVRDAGDSVMAPCWEVRAAKAEHLYIDPHNPESKAQALSLHEFNLVEILLSLRNIEDRFDREDKRRLREEADAKTPKIPIARAGATMRSGERGK